MLLKALRENPFVLAPMAGITDSPFRSFMKAQGAGIVISELISSHGIHYQSRQTLMLMQYGVEQRPVGIQLFGEDPDTMARAAQFVEEKGADFVDINLGCPVPKVVKKGAGSALLRDPVYLEKYLATIKKAIRIPLTIKIRTGWDQSCVNALDVVKAAANAGVTWVAIHGRTRAQGYSGTADWDLIASVKSQSPIPIIGNGDIHTAQQAVSRLQSSGCDGVMIGRGCLKNPFIFRESLSLWKSAQIEGKDTFERYSETLPVLHEYLKLRGDDKYTQLQLKKFSAWFSAGFPYSHEFRKEIFKTEGTDQILQAALGYFSRVKNYAQQDTSQEGFLMGGHG